MDIHAIRRANLQTLIEGRFSGRKVDLAKTLDKQSSQISRYFSDDPEHGRKIGDGMARQVEKRLGLSHGWMDNDHSGKFGELETTLAPRFRVPLISQVQAGNWQKITSNPPGDVEWVEVTRDFGRDAFALRVKGDSMEPKIPDGSIVIVSPGGNPTPGQIIVVRLNDEDEATLKEYAKDGSNKFLKPTNPRYPIIKLDRPATFCGRVRQLVLDFD